MGNRLGTNNVAPEKNSSSDICVICLDDLKKQIILKCSHSFCKECIKKHQSIDPRCPLCRQDIQNIEPQWITFKRSILIGMISVIYFYRTKLTILCFEIFTKLGEKFLQNI